MDLQLLAVEASGRMALFPFCLPNNHQVKRILSAKTQLLYVSEAGSLSLQEITFVTYTTEVTQRIVPFFTMRMYLRIRTSVQRSHQQGLHLSAAELATIAWAGFVGYVCRRVQSDWRITFPFSRSLAYLARFPNHNFDWLPSRYRASSLHSDSWN